MLTIQNRCLGAQRGPAGKCDDKACSLRLFDWHAPRRSRWVSYIHICTVHHAKILVAEGSAVALVRHSSWQQTRSCKFRRCHRGKKSLDILRGKWNQCPLRRGSWCTCVFNGRKWAVEPFPCICFACCWIKRCSGDGCKVTKLDIFQEVTLNTFRVWNWKKHIPFIHECPMKRAFKIPPYWLAGCPLAMLKITGGCSVLDRS